jgi:hypothetical protein
MDRSRAAPGTGQVNLKPVHAADPTDVAVEWVGVGCDDEQAVA